MGQMSVFGFWFRYFWMEDISEQAWNYWLVCIPIVPIGAPLGSICATMVTRMTLGLGLKPSDIQEAPFLSVDTWSNRKSSCCLFPLFCPAGNGGWYHYTKEALIIDPLWWNYFHCIYSVQIPFTKGPENVGN